LSRAETKLNSLDRNILITRPHWSILNLCRLNKYHRRPRITSIRLSNTRRRVVLRDLSQLSPISRYNLWAECLYPVSRASSSTSTTLTSMASCTSLALKVILSLGRIQTHAFKRLDLLQVLSDRVVQVTSSAELRSTSEL
jgi:hypothetical protein